MIRDKRLVGFVVLHPQKSRTAIRSVAAAGLDLSFGEQSAFQSPIVSITASTKVDSVSSSTAKWTKPAARTHLTQELRFPEGMREVSRVGGGMRLYNCADYAPLHFSKFLVVYFETQFSHIICNRGS